MHPPVRNESLAFLSEILGSGDRVLVTGAGGWFGLTIAALLDGTNADAMFITQRPRTISWGTGSANAVGWDLKRIIEFAPTIVIDCAFILRDYLGEMTLESYIAKNQILTSQMLQLASLNSVKSLIYVSSGAAVHPIDALSNGLEFNPYGHIKRTAELAALRIGEELGKHSLVARPFSLSGSLVTRPERYAFSNMLLQARSGGIHIEAKHQVFRKYISVEDFFAVAIATAKKKSGYLNSSGDLVEFTDLAGYICNTLKLKNHVLRTLNLDLKEDDYYSRDSSWQEACSSLSYSAASLEEQIINVNRYLSV